MDDVARRLVYAKDVEATMLKLAEHLKYPVGPKHPVTQKEHVLMMNYLPDVPEVLAYHLAAMGWRWHPELAVKKQVKITGGLFDDLVGYVPIDQPGDPIVVENSNEPNPDPDLWSVKPVVNEIYEERTQ